MSKLISIEGYDRYYISDEGKVFSDKYNRRIELNPRQNTRGYLYVNLYKNGKMKSVVIHRLVAKHFSLDFNPLMHVNHIDGIKTNNNISNLEMVTQSGNMQHAVTNGLLVNPVGEDHWCAKLTEEKVKEIKDKYIPRIYTQNMLAKEYGVSREAIKCILYNKTWKFVK